MNTQLQQQQQQPVVVYPNAVSGQQAPPVAHSHSDGSFGTVFIVLAVIIVVSGIACCLGRLCYKRKASRGGGSSGSGQGTSKHNKPPPAAVGGGKQSEPNPNFRMKERGEMMRGREREGGVDLEFGFDKGFPAGKPPGISNGRVHNRPDMPEIGHPRGGHGGGPGMPEIGHPRGGHGGGESFVIDGGHLKPGP